MLILTNVKLGVIKLGSLFSGGGLGDFGFLAAGMDVAWQCEIDPACQKRLALRYPESKKYTDIRDLKGAELEKVDIITGGFPCQPFSVDGCADRVDRLRMLGNGQVPAATYAIGMFIQEVRKAI